MTSAHQRARAVRQDWRLALDSNATVASHRYLVSQHLSSLLHFHYQSSFTDLLVRASASQTPTPNKDTGKTIRVRSSAEYND